MKEIVMFGAGLVLGLYSVSRLFGIAARKVNWWWWYSNIYMKSPHWKIKRWMKKETMRFLVGGVWCEKCGKTKRLQVHHRTYVRLGREKMADLEVLCHTCHMKVHNK